MKNQVTLARMSKLILQPENGSQGADKGVVAAFIKNLEPLGYTLSSDLIQTLLQCSTKQVSDLFMKVLPILREMVGANKKYKPFYPNFPRQIMEATDAELYINAIIHYVGSALGLLILPEYEEEVRDVLTEWTEVRVIGLGTEEDLHQMFSNLMASNTSISATDQMHLDWYIQTYQNEIRLPNRIPHKEVLSIVLSSLMHNNVPVDVIARLRLTATDVLRLATALSGGDVSLAQNTKFRKLKRKERRFLLAILDGIETPQEDMQRHAKRWLRLGEILHPGEYKERYQNAFEAFQCLRDNKKIVTFNSMVEGQFLNLKYSGEFPGVSVQTQMLSNLLQTRPGEFARRLDHLLRLTPQSSRDNILNDFATVADKVATPVLLQVLEHFQHRHLDLDQRVFFPKGNVGKLVAVENHLQPLELKHSSRVVQDVAQVLIQRFSQLEALGNVYIDPALRGYKVPFSQRSASKSLRTLVRGSRIPFGEEDKNTIRFFIWWKNLNSGTNWGRRVDLDLSAVLLNDDWKYMEHVSYTNLKSARYQACHSGDVTNAPNGACEFIDIDIPSALKYKARYVVMNVISFTGQSFVSLPECYAGWMLRKKPQSGEVFDGRTVQDKIDVSADTKYCIPMVLDLKTREMIWADLALKTRPEYANNVERNQRGITALGKAIAELRKPDLYTLFELHALGRGQLVTDIDDADTVFSPESAFDYERILSEFLS